MGELILHIGTPKTGTTSLQKFLCENRSLLLKNGVYYPQFTPQKKEIIAIWRNGCFLARYCRALTAEEEISNQVSDFEENYKKLADALSGNKRVLLSDENLCAFSTFSYGKNLKLKKYWQELAGILKELGVKNTTIIVYLRRQDDYAISYWKEVVKNGFTKKSIKRYSNEQHVKCRLDYASILDAIKDAFNDSAKLVVRSYNQIASSDGSIYQDFCDSLGIAWDSGYIIPKGKQNESISFDMVEMLRTCKYGGSGRGNEEKKVRNRLATALSRKHPDPKGTTVFSPKEAATFMEEYLDGNRRIAEEYCDNKSLFSDEYNDGPMWIPNRLRIFKYRAAFICPKLSLKICSGRKSQKKRLK